MPLLQCLGLTKVSGQFWGLLFKCCIKRYVFAPRPTPKLEDHSLSAVCNCLCNIFAAALYIGGHSSIRNLCCGDWDSLITYSVQGWFKNKTVTLDLHNIGGDVN
jgi:hypothetical protein